MIRRICISINNRCNLRCRYCHFHEKQASIHEEDMDVPLILSNVKRHMSLHPEIETFKIGFVGNGEPLLDLDKLKGYVLSIKDYLESGKIAAYTITNGTVTDKEGLSFLIRNNVNVGFSIDGIKEIHDKWRCGSFDAVMKGIEAYKEITGKYPSMNCTVGQDVIDRADETIAFFSRFANRITFSRMIGRYGISMERFRTFIAKASEHLNVRTGGYDCTMYGGKCAAGIDNLYFANGRIFICGNCVDLPTPYISSTPLDDVDFNISHSDRNLCYKESLR